MGRKKMPGLVKRGQIWHINKKINGKRISESTGTSELAEAERYLVHRLEAIRQASVYGVRPKRIFREAATKYLLEKQHKASIKDEASVLKHLDSFIGDLPLEAVHIGSLQPYILSRKQDKVKARTINYGLQVIRQILNLAAGEWLDEHGLTWIASAPKIRLLPENDKRKPYPLDWQEQALLFGALPYHLRQMALFAVNTGCRDREICKLRWEWEVPFENGSVFIIPAKQVKNREDRLVVLNRIAKAIIDEMRGKHPEYIFTYNHKPLYRMSTVAWKKIRKKVGLPQVRVHDLKHTFGRRLRAAGVSFEDRQDLLGHKSGRITTHYSAAELANLINAANKVCVEGNSTPVLTILRSSAINKNNTRNLIANLKEVAC